MAAEMRGALPTTLAVGPRRDPEPPTGGIAGSAPPELEFGPEFDTWRPLLLRLATAGPVIQDGAELVDRAAALWMRPGFDTFISLPRLRFTPFPYQLKAAETALRRMRGRALLADEVGRARPSRPVWC